MSNIDLSALSGVASQYMEAQVQNVAAEKLKSVAKKDYSGATDEELMNVCKQFESYFLEQVFKEMEKTVPESQFNDQSTSSLVSFFKDNARTELASQSTDNNSLGLAQMLYEQMKRNYDL